MRSLLTSTALFLAAACASTAHSPLETVPTLRRVDVSYRAELAPGAVSELPASTPSEPGAPVGSESLGEIVLHARFLRLDPRVEGGLFGPRSVEGRVLDASALEEVLAKCEREGRLEVLQSPSLRVEDGQRAYIALMGQTAYVKSFELTGKGPVLVADPLIDVATEGIVLHGAPRLGVGAGIIELDLELEARHVEQPIREIAVNVPGVPRHMTMQVPLTFEQHLATRIALAPHEVLVLRGLVDQAGRPLLACVRGQLAPGDEMAAAR